MKHLRAIAIILFLLLVVIVAVENYQALSNPVNFKVDLGFYKYESKGMPMALMAVIAFLIGVISMGLYGITERFHLKRRIKALRKEAEAKDKELNSLRNLPVTTEGVGPDQSPETQG